MQTIAKASFVGAKFNFSLNGTTLDQPTEFVDLATVIEFYCKQSFVDETQVFVIGHSRGGGAVLLQAYYNERVTGAISWTGVADFKKRFPQHDNFEQWKKEGVFYSINGRTKQEMSHYFSFWKDFVANE